MKVVWTFLSDFGSALNRVAFSDGYTVEVQPTGDTCDAFADYDAETHRRV